MRESEIGCFLEPSITVRRKLTSFFFCPAAHVTLLLYHLTATFVPFRPHFFPQKINLEVFLHNNVFVTFTGSCQTSLSKTMSCVLALWFENMNFSLSDLTGPSLKPEKTPTCLVPSTDKDMDDMDDIDDMDDMEFFFRTFNYRHHGNSKIRIPLPPFELQKSEMKVRYSRGKSQTIVWHRYLLLTLAFFML